VRLLLDTNAAVWLLGADPRLGRRALDEYADETNDVLLSSVAVWEVAIKQSLGKLRTPGNLRGLLRSDVLPLPVTLDHAAAVEALPWHHRDPFDRMLVAQAQVEGAAIVSGDPAFASYDVPVVW
jgi:PIN domain nuclease of toxin-antitoxin system